MAMKTPSITSAGTLGKQQRGGLQMHWTSLSLLNSLDKGAFILALDRGAAAYTAGFASRVEAYAKENAPWEDRTGDARDGLTAKGQQRLFEYRIILYHTVDYGIWLEVRWNGKYAIIVPTIIHMGNELMSELSMVLTASTGTVFIHTGGEGGSGEF
jgi:hypothetical protein